MSSLPRPVIPLTVELGGDLARLEQSDAPARLRLLLRRYMNGFGRAAGVPGTPVVRVKVNAASGRALRVRAHDRVLPYPPLMLRRVWLQVLRSKPPVPWDTDDEERAFPDNWVARALDTLEDRNHAVPRTFVEFLARAAFEVVRSRPSSLVGEAQAVAYMTGQANGGTTGPPDRTASVLGSLLDLGVAVHRHDAILGAIAQSASTDEAIETAFTELKLPRVEIQAEPEYLKAILRLGGSARDTAPIQESSERLPSDLRGLSGLLREIFRGKVGVALPELVWVPERRIPAETIAIRVNDRRSMTTPELRPNEVVVDRGPGSLGEGQSGRPIPEVFDDEQRSAVPDEDAAELRGKTTTWTPAEFALLMAAQHIGGRADCLIDIDETLDGLARVHQVRRRLVEVALRRHAVAEIATIRRELVRDHLPVNDLRLVLERLVEPGTPPRPVERTELVEHVRKGYASRFESQLHPDFGTPPEVYRLAHRLCTDIASGQLDDDEAEATRDLVWREVSNRILAGSEVWIATEPGARAAVRKFLATELPGARVVATSEIPAQVTTRRIGAGARVGSP